MKKIKFNKKRFIICGVAVACMSLFFLRNSAFSSPFETISVNGVEYLIEHNAKTDMPTWTQTDYINYLHANGKSWSVADSLAITNAGPGATIQKRVCVYKNQYNSTCVKNEEGIWIVSSSGSLITKLQ